MSRYRVALTSWAAAIGFAPHLVAQPNADPTLEEKYATVLKTVGAEYRAARELLLGGDADRTKAFLEAKRAEITDPTVDLCVEALLVRLGDSGRLNDTLNEAWRRATAPRRSQRVGVVRGPPRPFVGGAHLARRLGRDAAPFAAELLCKGLTQDWASWQKQALVWALHIVGRRDPPRPGSTVIKDPRCGSALLWVVENEPDDECAATANRTLRHFASAELLAAVQTTRDRVASERRRDYLNRAVREIAYELRRLAKRP